MAGDWIKLEKTTPDKPEIARLARALAISQAQAFLEFVRAYIWADGVVASDDGYVPNLSFSEADTLSRCRCGTFAALARAEIEWVVAEQNGLRFVNWNRHNGKSSKARALDNERKHMSRRHPDKCPKNVRLPTGHNTDQRREEKSIKPPVVPRGRGTADSAKKNYTPSFLAFWEVYPNLRRVKKISAWRAWQKAIKQTSTETILEAVREFAKSPLGRCRYCPGPEPWLNQGRWEDDRKAWLRGDDDGPLLPLEIPLPQY